MYRLYDLSRQSKFLARLKQNFEITGPMFASEELSQNHSGPIIKSHRFVDTGNDEQCSRWNYRAIVDHFLSF